MKDRLKPLDNDSRLKSKIIASLDQSFDNASDREHSTFIEQSRIILKSPLPRLSHNRSKIYTNEKQEKLAESMFIGGEMRYDTKQLEYERIKSKVMETERMKSEYEAGQNINPTKSYLTPNDFM